MWLDIAEMKYLLDHAGDMPSYIREKYEEDLERAEKRQKEREEKKRQERYKLYDAIYTELKDGRSYTPTDLQFLLYNHAGKSWSCQRISRLLLELSCLCCHDPEVKKRWSGVKIDAAASHWHGNRGKAFYHIVK